MIDTIHAYIKNPSKLTLEALNKFKNGTVHYYKSRDIYIQNYKIKGIALKYYFRKVKQDLGESLEVPLKLKMFGSLHKFIHGNNVQRADRLSISRAVLKLIRISGVDELRDFKLTRIDFGLNVKLNYNVFNYINRSLSPGGHLKRKFDSRNSIRFETATSGRVIRMYNKIKEVKEKGSAKFLSTVAVNSNILRFEVSMQNNLKSLKVEDNGTGLLLHEITTDDFFNKNILELEKRFDSLKFKSVASISEVTNTYELMDFLKLKGIESLGGIEKLSDAIEKLRSKGKINKNGRDYMIKAAKKLNTKGKIKKHDKLIEELSNEFKKELVSINP